MSCWFDNKVKQSQAQAQKNKANSTHPQPITHHHPPTTMSSVDSNDSRSNDLDYVPLPVDKPLSQTRGPGGVGGGADDGSVESFSYPATPLSVAKAHRVNARNHMNSLSGKHQNLLVKRDATHTVFQMADAKLNLRTNHCAANDIMPLADNEFMILKVDFNSAIIAYQKACDKVTACAVELDEAKGAKALADLVVSKKKKEADEVTDMVEEMKKRRHDDITMTMEATNK